jgi:hypothetical protein
VKAKLLLLAALALALAGCGSSGKQTAPHRSSPKHRHRVAATRPDPKVAGTNELGVIPVIMYHRVLEHPLSIYDTTPTRLRRELLALYRQGYRPILASDLVRGRIYVPRGKSPVVLTFDDSSPSQFALLPNGKVDPKTAVGIMLAFARKHRSFGPAATFFVNREPFGGGTNSAELLAELPRLGFELADHTYDHADLGTLAASDVQREIVLGERVITDAVPEAKVYTMALPYGVYPRPHELAIRGSWDGQSYDYQGVFEVGSGPAPSPYSIPFDPLAIPRILAHPWTGKPDQGSGYWLHYLKLHPDRRFVSDGDPDRISFGRIFAEAVAPKYRARANPY